MKIGQFLCCMFILATAVALAQESNLKITPASSQNTEAVPLATSPTIALPSTNISLEMNTTPGGSEGRDYILRDPDIKLWKSACAQKGKTGCCADSTLCRDTQYCDTDTCVCKRKKPA
jgi:hypothetical protein